MIISGGDSGGGRPSVSISAGPTPSASRGYDQKLTDKTVDELIALIRTQYPASRYGDVGMDPAARAYLDNLQYIKDHPPVILNGRKQPSELDTILDAIFYASAIASVIPFPAFQIGGSIGMSASNAGRAIRSGNKYAGARYIAQMSRTVNRGYRYYQSRGPEVPAYRKRFDPYGGI